MNMCCKLLECITVWEIISLFLGIALSALAAIIIIHFFRPKICIGVPTKKESTLKIPVRNISKYYSAVNLRIEAAAVLNNQTYHLDFDRVDFLMLPPYKNNKNGETPFERTYQTIDIDNYTKIIAKDNCENMTDFFNLLSKPNAYLRIRVHAFHEFTGFGKAFQANFNFITKDMFVLKENINICEK